MITRELGQKIASLRHKFPVLTLTGPRQSGKTTLLKSVYSDLPYINLEDIDNRSFAINDPKGFLSNYPKGAVIDEVQYVPELFSYLQNIVDNQNVHFALSGSQNFTILQSITQSLAGRTAILRLLPFSFRELKNEGIRYEEYEEYIIKGMYPRIYDKGIEPEDFYPSYISTYIEKDVRQIKNIENLRVFTSFVQLCAGRAGQLLNINTLATDAGIAPNTAKAWLSVLEASYIVYFLKPYYQNFNKRIVKSPKLYFYDTGLACSLLGIEGADQLKTYYQKGNLFENFVINEFVKSRFNKGKLLNLYFWQNKTKQEVDLIVVDANNASPYEIKSGRTKQDSYFANLMYWQKLTNEKSENLNVIYGGDEDFKTSKGNFLSWKNL